MSSNGSELLSFENVSFGYGLSPAVEDVSFSVQHGDFVALLGRNGSGKTTLVKLAIGLEKPQRGSVRLFGKDVQDFDQWQRVGYVPQRTSGLAVQFPASVSDVVAQGEYRRFDPGALFRRRPSPGVKEALHTVGMWEHRDQLIHQLSGGQQQRVLIGRAIVHKPDLLILDEPTRGVDRTGQEEFLVLLRRLRQEQGVTILLVSHDIGAVLPEATHVACIDCRLLCYATPGDLTDGDLSRLYGHAVTMLAHRHG